MRHKQNQDKTQGNLQARINQRVLYISNGQETTERLKKTASHMQVVIQGLLI